MRGWRRRLIVAVAILCALVLVLGAAFSWTASQILLVPRHDLNAGGVRVVSLSPAAGTVTLERTAASARPGIFGLDWSGGHAFLGPIVSETATGVTRRLTPRSGTLRVGQQVGIDTDVFTGTPEQAYGLAYRDVEVPDPLGPMPAWFVPAAGSTWVIFVHGIDGNRDGGMRYLPTLHALGLPVLLITYRNDVGAPPSSDGLIHLGGTEWQDLQAAVVWALGRGAARLVLYGVSMGGAIVTRFMRASPLASRVTRLVLDAPALDWQSILANQAARLHLPFMAGPVELVIQFRIGINWGEMNEIQHAGAFHLPILLFQGSADPLVPPADSAAFARAAPGPVHLIQVPGAAHIQSWNVDSSAYDAALRAFLGPVAAGR
ncbi:MAG: alpha/beta hydrolase [Candidatus Dormibacteraceae bacterium]